MKYFLIYSILFTILSAGCNQTEKKIVLPDMRSNFSSLLTKKDSTLSLDSFYFIRLDTMTEKKALKHQRFSYFHIMENIDKQLNWMSDKQDSFHKAPSSNDLETVDYLKGEQTYVQKEIDSLNTLIKDADSIHPVGFRALYKATVSKKDKFVVSDTFPYSVSLKMKISDWDRNIQKTVEALATGKALHASDSHP